MKEKPILFQSAMVRALLAGTKTKTRREIKRTGSRAWAAQFPDGSMGWKTNLGHAFGNDTALTCPYGQSGEQLWVRETFYAFGRWVTQFSEEKGRDEWHFIDMTLETGHSYCYAADGGQPALLASRRSAGVTPAWWKRPAIHMPRAASRILLEITDVRVERLQSISEADAKAEGCERLQDDEPGYVEHDEPDWKLCPQCGGTNLYTAYGPNLGAMPDTDCEKCDTYVKRYRWLWESINGGGSWNANPFVWVVSFRKVRPC